MLLILSQHSTVFTKGGWARRLAGRAVLHWRWPKGNDRGVTPMPLPRGVEKWLRGGTRVAKEHGEHVLLSDLGLKSITSCLWEEFQFLRGSSLLPHLKQRCRIRAKDSQSKASHRDQESVVPRRPPSLTLQVWSSFSLACFAVLSGRQASPSPSVLGNTPQI